MGEIMNQLTQDPGHLKEVKLHCCEMTFPLEMNIYIYILYILYIYVYYRCWALASQSCTQNASRKEQHQNSLRGNLSTKYWPYFVFRYHDQP